MQPEDGLVQPFAEDQNQNIESKHSFEGQGDVHMV